MKNRDGFIARVGLRFARGSWALTVCFIALMSTNAISQDRIPILRFEEPHGFYRSAITPPNDYSATQFNASLQVYPFRPFQGDIERMFKTTLLRNWIDPRFQELNVVGQPEFKTGGGIPGAQFVIGARFVDSSAGLVKTRMRFLIVAGGAAALLDMNAHDAATWQRYLPLLDPWFASLRVDMGTPAVPRVTQSPGPAGRAIAGLYMAITYKSVADFSRPLAMMRVPALYYYLLSADGYVYRAYDDLHVPGGDPSRFDFDAAQRTDPVNSGRYSVVGNQMRIEMTGPERETITATVPANGQFKIGSTEYNRQ